VTVDLGLGLEVRESRVVGRCDTRRDDATSSIVRCRDILCLLLDELAKRRDETRVLEVKLRGESGQSRSAPSGFLRVDSRPCIQSK
jgi:hypothetical protein